MEDQPAMAVKELMDKLGLESRLSFRRNYIDQTLTNGLIKRLTKKNQLIKIKASIKFKQ